MIKRSNINLRKQIEDFVKEIEKMYKRVVERELERS